jgi:hypothetical protein
VQKNLLSLSTLNFVIVNSILGFSWKIAKCPICGQPLGWIWEPDGNVKMEEYAENRNSRNSGFYSLRLDKILDPGSRFLGPALEVPHLLKSIWSKIG